MMIKYAIRHTNISIFLRYSSGKLSMKRGGAFVGVGTEAATRGGGSHGWSRRGRLGCNELRAL